MSDDQIPWPNQLAIQSDNHYIWPQSKKLPIRLSLPNFVEKQPKK